MKARAALGIARPLAPVIGTAQTRIRPGRRIGAMLFWRRSLSIRQAERAREPAWPGWSFNLHLHLRTSINFAARTAKDEARRDTRQAPRSSAEIHWVEPAGRDRHFLRFEERIRTLRAEFGRALSDMPAEAVARPAAAGNIPALVARRHLLRCIDEVRTTEARRKRHMAVELSPSPTPRLPGALPMASMPPDHSRAAPAPLRVFGRRLAPVAVGERPRTAARIVSIAPSHLQPGSPGIAQSSGAIARGSAAYAPVTLMHRHAAAPQQVAVPRDRRRPTVEMAWPSRPREVALPAQSAIVPSVASAASAWPVTPSAPMAAAAALSPTQPDLTRIVDEVMCRIDRIMRSERLRRGL